MKKKLKGFLKTNIYHLIAFGFFGVVIAIIAWANYTPGTILTGWDNIQPEYAHVLNLKRTISTVWQENFGVGLLGGMSPGSDLPRQIILYLLSFIFPDSVLRYMWTFSMLFLGPWGMYLLMQKLLTEKSKKVSFGVFMASLAAGVFYLFNLATVQYFYTTYESFIGFYGFLPVLIYGLVRYFSQPTRKNILVYFLILLFASSAFYVQTLFIVYALAAGIFCVEYLIRKRARALVPLIVFGLVTFVGTFYYLVPSLLYTVKNSDVVVESKINSISTYETQLMNINRGTFENVSSLKGFWFDYAEVDETGQYQYLFDSWKNYLSEPISAIPVVLFFISLIGIAVSFKDIKKRTWIFTPLMLVGLSYFMLASTNDPFGKVFELITDKIPLFGQTFRSVFTKWSGLGALSYSLGVGLLVYILSTFKKKIGMILASVGFLALFTASFFVVKPIFNGDLFMSSLRAHVPQEYFNLFEFFDGEPSQTRIAHLPIYSFWGWNYYSWGYTGSGFLWYGIKQPIMDRAFDVWSPYNEDFYHEASAALSELSPEEVGDVFNKYDITYVLLDESITLPAVDPGYFKYEETKKLLESLDAKVVFKEGPLTVYKLNNANSFVRALDTYSLVSPAETFVRKDSLYQTYGDTVESTQSHYPFLNLFKERAEGVKYSDPDIPTITLTGKLNSDATTLLIPGIEKGTKVYVPVIVSHIKADEVTVTFDPFAEIEINGTKYTLPTLPPVKIDMPGQVDDVAVNIGSSFVTVPLGGTEETVLTELTVGDPITVSAFDVSKITTYDVASSFAQAEINTCWSREKGDPFVQSQRLGDALRIATKDAVGCFATKLGQPEGNLALFTIKQPYRSISSSRPHFCLLAEGPEYKCEHEEIFYYENPSSTWKTVERKIIVPTDKTYWYELSARPSDVQGETWSIEYKTPEITSYPLAAQFDFDSSVWADVQKESSFELPEEKSSIQVTLKAHKTTLDFVNNDRKDPSNCDVFKRGEYMRDVVDDKAIYTTNNWAAACDFTFIEGFANTQSHLIRYVGENVKGRSMKTYVYNKATNHVELEGLLTDTEGMFDTTFTLLPWKNVSDKGIIVNVESRSFGEESMDVLENVSVYSAPFDWIAEWQVGIVDKVQGDLTVDSSRKIGTTHYVVQTSGDGVLALSQGYDEGWFAYKVGKQPSAVGRRLSVIFPWLFGTQIEHTKVNGWSNGWLINQPAISDRPLAISEKETNSLQPTAYDNTIVIVYWPQYLQWFGFILIPVTFLIMIFPWRRKKKLPHQVKYTHNKNVEPRLQAVVE